MVGNALAAIRADLVVGAASEEAVATAPITPARIHVTAGNLPHPIIYLHGAFGGVWTIVAPELVAHVAPRTPWTEPVSRSWHPSCALREEELQDLVTLGPVAIECGRFCCTRPTSNQ